MAETSPSFTVTMNDGKSAKPEQPVPEPASKDMTWTDGKQTIKYTATAEMLPLHTDDGTLIGHMFALSYVSDAADKSDRPATFCWNGGPGGSSAMVNIGGLGPRRVPINTIKQLPCPTKPEDNPYSLLPTTDLVYLDAMGTGYSKVAEGYDPKATLTPSCAASPSGSPLTSVGTRLCTCTASPTAPCATRCSCACSASAASH